METQLQLGHHHSQEDVQNPGLHSVMEGGENEGEEHQHGEKKSMLKKVKDKAKKIKNTIKKHGHGHGHDHDHEDDDEENDDEHPQLHVDPMYESTVVRSRNIPKEGITNLENPRNRREDRYEDAPQNKIPMGLVEDPHSPNNSPADFPSRPGGKEPDASQNLVPRFNNLNLDEKRPDRASPDHFTPGQTPATKTETNPVCQPENKESNSKTYDSADTQGTTTAHDSSSSNKPISESASEYAQKVAETLAPVYDKVAGAGNFVISKIYGTSGGGEDEDAVERGVSMKEYLSEKFRPGDEDRELSEVITNALHKKKETMQMTGKKQEPGKVTVSEEVAARLGDTENKREGKDAVESGQQSSGQGMVDRFKDAVGLWLGKSDGMQTAQDSVARSYVSETGSGSRGAS